MKRGFWALIAVILVLIALGVLFWPKSEYKKYVTEFKEYANEPEFSSYIVHSEFRDCLTSDKISFLYTKSLATQDLSLCEDIAAEIKFVCMAKINKDASFCEQLDEEGQKVCLAAYYAKIEVCNPTDIPCFALAGDSSLCKEDEACVALANLNYSFFENKFGSCISEYEKISQEAS